MSDPVLNKKDLDAVSRRWMPMAVNTYNYQYQQAGSIVYALYPALRKIYKDDDQLKEAIQNHYNYFNCHPWLSPIVLGAALAIEDNGGLKEKDIVQNLKTSLMGPLSGVGDTIIWVLFPTIIGSIAGYMALDKNPAGALAWIIINIVLMLFRYRATHLGYSQGTKLITSMGDKVAVLTESASILGLVVVGSLVATAVNVSTPLILTFGEVETEIQPLVDRILPKLIPVLIVYGIYKLLKSNKIGITGIIMLIIVCSMVAAFFGILG